MDPVVENAQHDPHEPWFLTWLTQPLAFQSTKSAFGVLFSVIPLMLPAGLYPRILSSSALVQVENSLWARVKVFSGLAFSASMSSWWAAKMACLASNSAVVAYERLNSATCLMKWKWVAGSMVVKIF